MIYVLLGKTCSGKTTLLRQLIEKGYKSSIPYTTRPKRPDETEGKDYVFLSLNEFKCLLGEGKIVAPRVYNDWYYGMEINSFNHPGNTVVIAGPKGYRDLAEEFGKENVRGIYLATNYEIRWIRGLNRKDDLNELMRRFNEDELDFEGLENEVYHVINSSSKSQTLEVVERILNEVSE